MLMGAYENVLQKLPSPLRGENRLKIHQDSKYVHDLLSSKSDQRKKNVYGFSVRSI